MKHIQKHPEPRAISNWKQQSNPNWHPTYATLCHTLKQVLKDALMREQGYLCCYCERSLTSDDSHIEHFRPQSDQTIDSLDFANLLCSCQKREPLHCGHLKGNWFDDKLLISPLDSTCESRFAFTADGHIKPRKEIDQAAKTTIEKLGLNIPKLRDLRKHAIEPFLDENLSAQEFQQFVQDYLVPLVSGEFSPFWTTIKYLF